MKPYLYPNSTLALVIEWGILIFSILLVFSPFIYLGIKKWKWHLPISWKQVFISYISSFAIYFGWEWIILNKLDRYIYNNYINTHWLQTALNNPGFKMIFILTITWPLLVFYCTKLTRGKFTLKNFLLSLFSAIFVFIILVSILFFMMAWGLTIVGNKYF